jgi:hypothetical protein
MILVLGVFGISIVFGFNPSDYIGTGGVIALGAILLAIIHPRSPYCIGRKMGWSGYQMTDDEWRLAVKEPRTIAWTIIGVTLIITVYVVSRL